MEFFYGFSLNVMGDGKTAINHLQKGFGYFEKAQMEMSLGHSWAGLGYTWL